MKFLNSIAAAAALAAAIASYAGAEVKAGETLYDGAKAGKRKRRFVAQGR